MNKAMIFDTGLNATKPENVKRRNDPCPFCSPETLTDILETDGPMIWLMNKYPVLQNSWQTVIVETDNCQGEFSTYTQEEARRILAFSLDKWRKTIDSKKFKSVLYFKNYGPYSGGSLRHPHSQIVGLYDYDYREDIRNEHFTGISVAKYPGINVTFSQQPLIGFYEFNLIVQEVNIPLLADCIQGILRYILQDFAVQAASYNIFFYDLKDEQIYIKIVPRFLTSPLFVGYKIPQVCKAEKAWEIIEKLSVFLPDKEEAAAT